MVPVQGVGHTNRYPTTCPRNSTTPPVPRVLRSSLNARARSEYLNLAIVSGLLWISKHYFDLHETRGSVVRPRHRPPALSLVQLSALRLAPLVL